MDFGHVELETEPVVLYPETRVVRGPAESEYVPGDPLVGYASLGRPLVLPLTPERVGDDKDLAAFIAAEAAHARYALVYLACTFSPGAGERVARAWVMVDLSLTWPADAEVPIAWSMEPMRASTQLNQNRTVSIKVPVGFVQATGQSGSTSTAEQIFCEALGLQGSRPSWEFTDTKAQRLRGSHRLHLVVRAPLAQGMAGLSLRAQVERRRLGLFSYTSDTDSARPIQFKV